MSAASAADISAPVLHSQDGRGVHRLVLNRPAAFNTLGEDVLAALQAALDTVAADGAARALVIAAEGKAFCAGHNLKEMSDNASLEAYLKNPARKKEPGNRMRVWKGDKNIPFEKAFYEFTDVVCALDHDV